MTAYHAPISTGKVEIHTAVWVKGYSINNPTMGNEMESQLNLELTFMSNDYSPNKYKVFLEEFQKFLGECNYLSGEHN
ncbi:hypothetical protein [Bacillus thuringiensis]|uniref:Uncharacterized protein n=1 Tax=Bacillus thuringiensis Bt18247 TaxID=1423143 RepID=A0A9W3X939_BACTU|nr:hypothetical protein [Bacillus thuringiensis]AOM11227.1 hypothetical protein BTI247_28380 [Bacillus thuringiensis Bt18247]MBG9529427.1 hypothetical protein [Bacillus thuringiensis]